MWCFREASWGSVGILLGLQPLISTSRRPSLALRDIARAQGLGQVALVARAVEQADLLGQAGAVRRLPAGWMNEREEEEEDADMN